MNAPYDVLGNLLRLRNGKTFSTKPFLSALNAQRKKPKPLSKSGPPPGPAKKIPELKKLSQRANLARLGQAFDKFYSAALRNAISHADYVLTDADLRTKEGYFRIPPDGTTFTPIMPFDRLAEIVNRAFAFYSAFFVLERSTRASLGTLAGKQLAYDTVYKGVLELLANHEGLVSGFVLHWPNGTDTIYERTRERCVAQNFSWDSDGGIVPMVGVSASSPGSFSPLVEEGASAGYTETRSGNAIQWPDENVKG